MTRGVASPLCAALAALGAVGFGGAQRPRAPERAPAVAAARAQEAFPHERHAGLFPLCTGCHAGAATGARAELYPAAALCARCHDGDSLQTVAWRGPEPRVDNVEFDHAAHGRLLARAGDADPGCAGCHAESPAQRMRVAPPDPDARCLGCHGHPARGHLTDAPCATCHVPLAETGFAARRIAALPEPADHGDEAFLERAHGEAARADAARCATCHVQERCTTCHVDATLAAVRAVPAAGTRLELPEFAAARYPVPATHTDDAWIEAHGERASRVACGTCHTRNDCATCHEGSAPPAVAELPERGEVSAPGAGAALRPPPSHRTAFFARDHGGAAAARATACATCHAPAFCAECHAQAARVESGGVGRPVPPRLAELLRAPPVTRRAVPAAAAAGTVPRARATEASAARTEPGFHPASYTLRHATAAHGQTMECASCHSVEAFCRACHVEAGMTPALRPGPGFHDAGANWLLGHGRPARQGLEACASCHRQTDCVQCHSTIGAFRANPHGPGFDAAQGWARAPGTCLICHQRKPL